MIDQPHIMLIMNCKKYINKALYQKQTWLKSVPPYLLYYHVIGDETMEEDFRFSDEERILWVRTPDDYNSLPKKVIAAYAAVLQTFNFKYIHKTDDDQLLVNPAYLPILCKMAETKKPQIHYAGFVVDLPANMISKYYLVHPELPTDILMHKTKYCSGRYYFLSKEAVTYLVQSKRRQIESEYLEDYAIGVHLHPTLKITMQNIPTNNYFTDSDSVLNS